MTDCEQIFEGVGSKASWKRLGLNRLAAAFQTVGCVKVATLVRLVRSRTKVMELLNWLRETA